MSNKQFKDLITAINNRVNTVLQFDIIHELIRNAELGTKSDFSELLFEFELIRKCVDKLRGFDLNVLSLERLTNLENLLREVVDTLNGIKSFDITKHNPQHRQNLIAGVHRLKDPIVNTIADLNKINSFLFDDDNFHLEAQKTIADIQSINSEARTILDNINDIKSSIKSAAEQTGVAKHSEVFLSEAMEYEVKAQTWQKWLFGILITTSLIAVCILFVPVTIIGNEANTSTIVQFTISKVVLFSICFYALSIINKNFKAYKHNAIINKHRHNALRTFETFIAGATDEQTKNAVLLQTTQAIFNSQNTGYNNSDADIDMSTKVIEIFKSTAQNGKSQ